VVPNSCACCLCHSDEYAVAASPAGCRMYAMGFAYLGRRWPQVGLIYRLVHETEAHPNYVARSTHPTQFLRR